MTVLGFLGVLTLCGLLGHGWAPTLARAEDGRAWRALAALVAGTVTFFLLLAVLDLVGVPWSRLSLVLGTLLVHLGLRSLVKEPVVARPPRRRTGWGTLVALVALAAVGLACLATWGLNPDFIYHWGIKGKRFFLARAFDFDFLALPWSKVRHPDYPNLLPGLFGATGVLAGRFGERGMLLWSALAFGGLLVAARETLLRTSSSFAARATLGGLALAGAAFGIGYFTLGGPDWLIALAPVAAWPAFLGTRSPASDRAVGWIAALAAASKIEGMPLGAFLVGLYFLGRGRERWRALPALLLPTAAVVACWLWGALSWGLFVEQRGGTVSFTHAATLAKTFLTTLTFPEWHRASWIFLALPLLWLPRVTRPIAAVVTLQALFYAYVYLSFPLDTAEQAEYLVRSNGARLAFHLFPAVVVGAGVLLGRLDGGNPEGGHVGPPLRGLEGLS
ncbi:MAG TPA: hypothetical protein VF017_20850 [Thermoanaerobaculia bacterium]|nr:hypothetical protein [Thermoanaerobaculia bacterium]